MTFKEWLIKEAGTNVRNRATRNSGIDQSVLHGYAAQFGRPDTPSPVQKGIDATVTGVGKGVAAGLDRRGLEVQASPDVLGVPKTSDNFGFKDANLVLQTPLRNHNNTVVDEGRGLNFDSSGFFRKVMENPNISAEKIRFVYNSPEINDGKYHPLYRRDEEGNWNADGEWNYDTQKAKQFTRALMLKIINESPAPRGFTEEEREMYDIYSPEVVGEQINGMYMVSVFKFKKKKNAPEILKGGE